MARRGEWVLAVAGGVLVLALALVVTRSGLGVSTDSSAYLAEARALRTTGSLDMPAGIYAIYAGADRAGDRDLVTGTHFPPLYPIVLAVTGTGAAIRWLNALLLVVTAGTVAVMVWRYSRSRAAASLAAALVALSPAVLRTHAMVWSEPLFVALGVVGLLALACHLESGSAAMLAGSSLAIGLAWLTRYAGVAFVAAGLVVLLVRGHGSRWRRCGMFVLLSAGPLAMYLSVMAASGAEGSGYSLAFDGIPRSAAEQAGEALRAWVLPAGTPSPLGLLVGLPLAAAAGVLTYRSGRPGPGGLPSLPSLPALLAISVLAYAATLVAAGWAFAEEVHLDERVLAPAYVLAVALLGCGLSKQAGRVPFAALAALGAGIVASTAVASWELVRDGAVEDRGFAARRWTESAVVRAVDDVPKPVGIYTNFPEALFVGLGRPARLLPEGGDRSDVTRLVDDVQNGRAVVVFYDVGGRAGLVSPEELAVRLGLPTAADRGVYRFG